MGKSVYTENGRDGGIHMMSYFVLGKSMFSEREKKKILASLQSLTVTSDTYSDGSFP